MRALVLVVVLTGCRSILGIDDPIDIGVDAPGGHGHGGDGGLPVDASEIPTVDAPLAIDAPPGVVAAVQSTYGDPSGNVQTVMATFSIPQTAGNFNVVVAGWLDNNANITSVTDSAGSTYVAVSTAQTKDSLRQQMYYGYIAKTGANTVTVQYDRAASFPDVRAAEYENVALTNPIDAQITNTGNGKQCDSGLLATTNTTDLLVASNVMTTYTTGAGTGFTERSLSQPDQDLLEDQVVRTAGSYRAQMSLDVSTTWAIQLVAFKSQ